MVAVICGTRYWVDVEKAYGKRDEEIVYVRVGEEISITSELEKISRIGKSIMQLFIDVTVISDYEKLPVAIRRYRIKSANTQIILFAPNHKTGDKILSSVMLMGVYDIIAPDEDDGEDYDIPSIINKVTQEPTTYSKAVKWDVGMIGSDDVHDHKEEHASANEQMTKEKIVIKKETKIEYVEKIQSVFKKIIAVYSPANEGASTATTLIATALARSKECRVLLMDFNVLNPVQKELFGIDTQHSITDTIDAVIKKDLTPAKFDGFLSVPRGFKNLYILTGIYDVNEYYVSQESYYEEILQKARLNFDYVIVDTHCMYDLFPTNAALRMADDVIVITRARTRSIKTVNRYLDCFDKYGDFDVRKFKIVINHYRGNDPTSIEINSKCKYPVIGYLSKHKEYEDLDPFKKPRLINESLDILNGIGIRIKKRNSISDLGKTKKEGDSGVC